MLFNLKVLAYLDVLLLIGLVGFRAALLLRLRSMVGPKVVTLVLVTPAVALLAGNIYVFHAYLFCVAAFTSRTRTDVCATYLLMLPLVPGLQLDLYAGGTYLLALTSFTSMNAGALVGMALTRGPVRRTDALLDVSMLVLIAIFVLISIRGVSGTAVLRIVIQNLLLLGPPYLLVSRTAVDADDVRKLLMYLCLAAFLGSIVAIFGLIRRWDLYEPFYAALHVQQTTGSSALAVRGGRMRMGGPFVDYTAFGLFLAVLAAVVPTLRAGFSRGGFAAVSAGLVAGLFTTQSRGAWVGLLVGFAVLQWLRGRRGTGLAMLGGGAMAYLALGALLAPSSRLAETLGTSGASTETGDYRRRLLDLGMDQVMAHPLTGQAPEVLTANLSMLVQGQHIVDFVNTHLYVAMAAGIFALVLWTMIWISIVIRLAARRRQGTADLRRSGLAVAPAAMIVTTFVSLTFTSTIDRNLYWLLLAAGFATPLLVRASARVPVQAEPARAGYPGPAA